jgi:hypothetical protein
MSTEVTDIYNSITTLAQTVLGSDYVRLKKVFDPGDENNRSIAKGFGVRHGEANSTSGNTRAYTLDQVFELVIVNRASNRDNDLTVQSVFNELYSKAHDFLSRAFLTRLGLPSCVLLVNEPGISEPQLLAGNEAALLVVRFNVRYMKAIA